MLFIESNTFFIFSRTYTKHSFNPDITRHWWHWFPSCHLTLKKLWLIVSWLSQTLQLSRDALHLRFHYTIPHVLPNANFTCECNNSKGKSLVYCSFLGLKISLLKPDVPPAHLSCCGALLTQTDSLSCKKHFDLANFRIMKRRWYVLGDRCCAVTEGAVYVRTWLRFDAVRRRV